MKNYKFVTKHEFMEARWTENAEELYKDGNDNPPLTRIYLNEERPDIMDIESYENRYILRCSHH